MQALQAVAHTAQVPMLQWSCLYHTDLVCIIHDAGHVVDQPWWHTWILAYKYALCNRSGVPLYLRRSTVLARPGFMPPACRQAGRGSLLHVRSCMPLDPWSWCSQGLLRS